MLSDIEIAQKAKMKPIREIAAGIGREKNISNLTGNTKQN